MMIARADTPLSEIIAGPITLFWDPAVGSDVMVDGVGPTEGGIVVVIVAVAG